MVKQLLKIGNSVALTIPAEEVAKLRLKPGDQVEIYSDGESLKIVPIRKIRAVKLGGLFKGMDISEEDIAEVRREMWKSTFDEK
jgi:antitoxin component of MazEF toxin-antitoxin module